ncbi:MAG: endonuclease/exonuclease/phosphatase family protein, partial [Muribaculaceae bacterium]|nr:endonuclease/exonuclease/phosphatase family protein [Muribaculaceae bacterium]
AIDDGVADNRSGHTSILYNKNRFTVLDKGHFWLSPTPDTESRPAWGATDTAFRTTIWLLLHDNVANKDLYFFNTHLPYQSADKEARNECVKLNVARMKEKAGRHTPVFITGDMNASWHTQDGRRDCLAPYFEWMWSGREEANNLTPNVYSFNGFGESTPGVTWNIDHIFYRKATPVDFEVVYSDKYGVKYVSDHYPITLTLKY